MSEKSNQLATTKKAGPVKDEEQGDFLAPNNLVDTVILGRRIRALRILNGYDRATDLVAVLRSQYGVEMSERTLYAIERGEQMPHVDFMLAILIHFRESPAYIQPAVRMDMAAYMRRGDGPSA